MEYNQVVEKMKRKIQELIENGYLDEAKSALKNWVNIAPNDPEPTSILSVLLISEGRLDDVISILEEALEKGIYNADILFNLGYVYEIREDYQQAANYYYDAKILAPPASKEDIERALNHITTNYLVKRTSRSVGRVIRKVLFSQSIPDIRTYKVAKILAKAGVEVDLVYLGIHPNQVYKGLQQPYKRIMQLTDINEMIKYVNESDYDVVYCSNEPDYLTNLFLATNKKVIHDCHDMMSLRGNLPAETMISEYLANLNSHGNIYVTPLVFEQAKKRFNIGNKHSFILDNYMLEEQLPKRYYQKLSEQDGELHVVYQGGLIDNPEHHRYLEPYFLALAAQRVHVHFYTTVELPYYKQLEEKSNYLHWQGVVNPNELIELMTQYDLGLALLNVTSRNRKFLEATFPNKAWEYLGAGIPILFSSLTSFKQFNETYEVGEIVEDEISIEQIQRIKKITVGNDFLTRNNLLMDHYAIPLIQFLNTVSNKPLSTIQNESQDQNGKMIISGSYGSGNIGDELIAYSIKKSAIGPYFDKGMGFNKDLVRIFLPDTQFFKQTDFHEAKRGINQSSGLIFGGGGIFYDYGDLKQSNIRYRLLLAAYALLQGKPIYILNVGSSQILLEQNRELVRNIFNYADFISVRDETSKQTLMDIGVRNDIHVGADNVFSLYPEMKSKRTRKRNVIGIHLRPIQELVYNNPDKDNEVFERIAKFADHVIETYNVSVRLYSFYLPYDSNGYANIVSKSRYKDKMDSIQTLQTGELFESIAECKAFIGMSLHSLIVSSLLNTKFIGIGYHPKVKAFCDAVGQGNHFVDYPDFDTSRLLTLFDQLMRSEVDYDTHLDVFYEKCADTYRLMQRTILHPYKYQDFKIENETTRAFLKDQGLIL